MKHLLVVLLFFFVGSLQLATAQHSIENHKSDEYALELNAQTLKELGTENWNCEDRLCFEGEGYWNRTVPFNLRFLDNNTFTIAGNQTSYKGVYEITNDGKYIDFIIPEDEKAGLDGMLRGTYKLTKLTHDRMLLSSIVDDSSDYPHIFRFVTDAYQQYVRDFDHSKHVPNKVDPNDYSDEDRMRFTIEKIKKIASSKDITVPGNMENLTITELNAVLKEVLLKAAE